MEVGDHGRSAAGHYRAGILADVQHRAFKMGMAVDKPGGDIFAIEVDDLFSLPVFADPGDKAVVDSDVGLFHLSAKGVNDAGIGEDKVGGGLAFSNGDDTAQVFHWPSSRT